MCAECGQTSTWIVVHFVNIAVNLLHQILLQIGQGLLELTHGHMRLSAIGCLSDFQYLVLRRVSSNGFGDGRSPFVLIGYV